MVWKGPLLIYCISIVLYPTILSTQTEVDAQIYLENQKQKKAFLLIQLKQIGSDVRLDFRI